MDTESTFLYAMLKFACAAALLPATILNIPRASAQPRTRQSTEHNSLAVKSHSLGAKFTVVNLMNKVALYNFLSIATFA